MSTEAHQAFNHRTVHTAQIVVGVNGSSSSRAAAAWAAAEAHERGAELTLVHVVDAGFEHSYIPSDILDRNARQVVNTARAGLPQFASWVPTQAMYMFGHPARTLGEIAADAEMLVLGRRGHGEFASLLLGSVSASAASRASVPTVVIPRGWTLAGHEHSPVVVGVDESMSSQSALQYAFELAQRQGVDLRVVHAWGRPRQVASRAELVRDLYRSWRSEADSRIRALLEPWRSMYPRVHVEHFLTQGSIVGSLVRESKTAQALVVGGRAVSRLQAALARSVTYGCLLHAQSPIIVVPES